MNRNTRGGLRADLPAGPLTFGRFYDVFPFDNRLAHLTLSGDDLERVFAAELRRGRRGDSRSPECPSGPTVEPTRPGDVLRPSGESLVANERLDVVATDMLASGSVFAPVAPAGGSAPSERAPIAREVVARWLLVRGGRAERQPVRERAATTVPSGT